MAAPVQTADREPRMLEGVRAGEPTAFRALFSAHHEAVFRAALAVTLDRDLASDVTQDVFIKLHRQPPAELRGPLRGWLLRVTMNEALVLRRRLAAWGRLSTGRRAIESPEARLGKAQVAAQMRAAMAHLPAQQRAVLALHFDADQDPREIAEALGLTANHARVLLHRALARLRTYARERGLDFPADEPLSASVESPVEAP